MSLEGLGPRRRALPGGQAGAPGTAGTASGLQPQVDICPVPVKATQLICWNVSLQSLITWEGDVLVCVQKGEKENRGWKQWVEGDKLHLVSPGSAQLPASVLTRAACSPSQAP